MEEKGFEEALKELEEIVEKLERGNLPLEEALGLFEKGVELSRICHQKLEEAKRKVEILVKQGNTMTPRPFEVEGEEGN